MPCSEAQLAANRSNSARAKGPVSELGKMSSRKNALKHGMCSKVVTAEGDREEIDRRIEALTAEMKPMTTAGVILIAQMATLSVRSENAARQETAAIAKNVRHAADDFDEERIDRANALFEALAENPRGNLRKLKKMPEGVERLIDAWRDLRADLIANPEPIWAAEQLERAAHMTGVKTQHARGSRLGELSRAFWGDFSDLGELDGGLDDKFRREWARSMLLDLIDAEIAALEAHYETLNFEIIEVDRAEAGVRALFDPSKPACLARRYESEASRGFFKALKEFRKVEVEAAAQAEAAPTPAKPAVAESKLGSFRETPPPPDRQPSRAFPEAPLSTFSAALDRDGQPLRLAPLVKSPG